MFVQLRKSLKSEFLRTSDTDDGVISPIWLIFRYVVEDSELCIPWNFQLNRMSSWRAIVVARMNFFNSDIFTVFYPFFRKVTFALRLWGISTSGFFRHSYQLILLPHSKIQKFSSTRWAAWPILKQAYFTFFSKSERNVDWARSVPQQWNTVICFTIDRARRALPPMVFGILFPPLKRYEKGSFDDQPAFRVS